MSDGGAVNRLYWTIAALQMRVDFGVAPLLPPIHDPLGTYAPTRNSCVDYE